MKPLLFLLCLMLISFGFFIPMLLLPWALIGVFESYHIALPFEHYTLFAIVFDVITIAALAGGYVLYGQLYGDGNYPQMVNIDGKPAIYGNYYIRY